MIYYYTMSKDNTGYAGTNFEKAMAEVNRLNSANNRDIYLKMALGETSNKRKYQLGILDFEVNTDHGWSAHPLQEGEKDMSWKSVKELAIQEFDIPVIKALLNDKRLQHFKQDFLSKYNFLEEELQELFTKYYKN